MHWLLFLYLLLRLLHVSALMCHLQGASFILMSYLKIRNGCVVNFGGLCAPDFVFSALICPAELDKVAHETTTSGALRPQTTVLKSGSLILLEPSGPVKACNGIAFTKT
jgi:hypothetical protein